MASTKLNATQQSEELQLGMPNWREIRSERLRAITFLVAGVVFLLVALLGDARSGTVFFVLALAFVVLALRDWQVGRTNSNGSNDSEGNPLGGEEQLH